MGIKTVFIKTTGNYTYTIPNDFGSLVSLVAIGGGAGGVNGSTTNGANPGGGGAFSKSTSTTSLSAGQTVFVNIGAGGAVNGGTGGDTWLNGVSNAAPTLVSQGVLAKGAIGAAAGQSINGVGDVRRNGGGGVGGSTGTGGVGGAGGASAGRDTANGFAGAQGSFFPGGGGGGGGGGVGSAGGSAPSTTSGAGGSDFTGAAGPVGVTTGLAGTNGSNASGASGGGGGSTTTAGGRGGDGGAGTEYTQTSNGETAGAGGGGGGGGGTALTSVSAGGGGTGGLYGGGGGAGGGRPSGASYLGGAGAQGILILTYNDNLQGFYSSIAGNLETYFIDDYAVIDQFAATGSLWLWSVGTYGRIGDNTAISKSSPVQTVAPSGTNWRQVESTSNHTAAIKTDGTLWTWGHGNVGALGTNLTTSRSSPGQTVSAGTNWKQVSVGYKFVNPNQFPRTAAIKTDGTLWTWGFGGEGQMGDNTVASKSSPVQTIAAGRNWKQVSIGGACSAAIKTDGTLWLWGENTAGNLGDNTTTHRSSPVQTVAGGTNWKQVSSGLQIVSAVKTDGTLWTWGSGAGGRLGDGTTVSKSSPVQTVAGGTNWRQVSAGLDLCAAIKTDGTLWTWGHNDRGQLGDNTITHRSSPVQTVSGGTNWKQVICNSHVNIGGSVFSIKTNGTLWNWGSAANGNLGDNTIANKSSPVQTVAGGTNWKQVAFGSAIHFYDADNLYPK